MRTAAARVLYVFEGTSFKRETVRDVKRIERELRFVDPLLSMNTWCLKYYILYH